MQRHPPTGIAHKCRVNKVNFTVDNVHTCAQEPSQQSATTSESPPPSPPCSTTFPFRLPRGLPSSYQMCTQGRQTQLTAHPSSYEMCTQGHPNPAHCTHPPLQASLPTRAQHSACICMHPTPHHPVSASTLYFICTMPAATSLFSFAITSGCFRWCCDARGFSWKVHKVASSKGGGIRR